MKGETENFTPRGLLYPSLIRNLFLKRNQMEENM
jgi:hypothetical protein